LYGPKTGGVWSVDLSLIGPTGATGTNGNSILSGNTPPTDGQGANGDYYIDGATEVLFGPKAGGTWSTAPQVSLIGPAGATGATGATGSGAVFLSSGSVATATTIAGGLVGTGPVFPISGTALVAVPNATLTLASLDLGSSSTLLSVAQTFPKTITLTKINGTFDTTAALSLIGSSVTLTATVYTGVSGSNVLTPPVGTLTCSPPAYTGILAIGDVRTCTGSGSVTVNAGGRAVIVVSATASGVSLINTLVFGASFGLSE
jgi:hypothetical protein